MTKISLPVLVAGLLVSHAGLSRAEEAGPATAYTALRSMGKSLGSDSLNRVVELTGRGGAPQPTEWRIVISEGSRGTKEVKVAGARIVSQKTSSEVSPLKPIQLQDLNLDSSGAFDAANEQARKAKVPFTALDYTLRVSPATGKPVWDIELQNEAGIHVGGVRLAAHDGKLLAVSGLGQTPAPSSTPRALVSADGDHDSVQPTRVTPSRNTTTTATTTYTNVPPAPPSPRNDEEEGGFFSRAGRTLDHTTDAVGDTLNRTSHAVDSTVRHTGEKLQRFFTGHRDSDPQEARPD